MSWLRKTWHDQVGSKVIAGVILGGLGWVVSVSTPELWIAFYNTKVPIFWVLLALFIVWVFYGIYKRIIGRNRQTRSMYTKAQKELMTHNKKQIGNILWKWEVLVGGFHTGQPKILNLTPYCLYHTTPMKMKLLVSMFECPYTNCQNNYPNSSMYDENYAKTKLIIESEIEAIYELLQSKHG